MRRRAEMASGASDGVRSGRRGTETISATARVGFDGVRVSVVEYTLAPEKTGEHLVRVAALRGVSAKHRGS